MWCLLWVFFCVGLVDGCMCGVVLVNDVLCVLVVSVVCGCFLCCCVVCWDVVDVL